MRSTGIERDAKPCRRRATSKRLASNSAYTPWPRIRVPHPAEYALPPRVSRTRFITCSAFSGWCSRNQSANRSFTSKGSRNST